MTGPSYVAGYNIPGFLPEVEPATFDTFDEAKRFVIDELLLAADDCAAAENEAGAEELTAIAESVNLESGPFSWDASHVDGYAYWVEVAADV